MRPEPQRDEVLTARGPRCRFEAELATEESCKDSLQREEAMEADLAETRIVAAQLQVWSRRHSPRLLLCSRYRS